MLGFLDSIYFYVGLNEFDRPGWSGATRGRGTPQIPLSLAPRTMVSGGHRGPPDTIVFGAKDNGIWGAFFVNPTE